MSGIGIDFGNENCRVATTRCGGIEMLLNDYNLRSTPSYVAFNDKKRIIGVAAKYQQITNIKNTVSGIKIFLGRMLEDPYVRTELRRIPVHVTQLADGRIAFSVQFLNQSKCFGLESLTGMLFTKLKQISQASLKSKVKTCVISCPTFFTNVERVILLDAARIAGLKVLRLINETTATALAYGFYRNDMFTEKPHNVIFVDFGHSSLQVSACCFTKDNLKMLASAWDQIGGRDFDKALADHFCISMQGRARGRFKINPKSNARAYLRLLTAVEKLKKEMSITTTKLPLNIDNDDMDIGASMQQSEMKQICAKILQRVEQTFRRLLKESRLQLNQISALELVGGSSRIPAVKLIAEKVFKISASTRLNQDEAVSRGAAIQCAMLCPTVRVRQFSITDTLNFDVYLLWNDGLSSGKIPVFDKFHESPFTRSVTIKCRIPFTVCLTYADRNMGVFTFGDHVENNEVKVIQLEIVINSDNIVSVVSASVLQMTVFSTEKIAIKLTTKSFGYNSILLKLWKRREAEMMAIDRKETKRINAQNNLERFVYEMRRKLQDGSLEKYVQKFKRQWIMLQLNLAEEWLYKDGNNCEYESYMKCLHKLKKHITPIKRRAVNYEECPAIFNYIKNSIFLTQQAVADFHMGLPKYNHVKADDLLHIVQVAENKNKWLIEIMKDFFQTPRTVDCSIRLANLQKESELLNRLIDSVLKPQKHCIKKWLPSICAAPSATQKI